MISFVEEYGLAPSSREIPGPPRSAPDVDCCCHPSGEADVHEWDSWDTAAATPDVSCSVPLEKSGITAPKSQLEIWKRQTVFKNSIAAKLREVGMCELAAKLEYCHSEYTFATCGTCKAVRRFPNRCDLWLCPECAHHLQHRRAQQVEWWTKLVVQPKHVVLTIRNIWDLTSGHVREIKKYLGALRRRKFCRNWRGGFYRIECTLGRNGWHLHIHLLVDADWIDADELKVQWLSVTRGGGYIVKVRDCRDKSYLREVTKYVVKSSTLAKWDALTLQRFVLAFTGQRLFGVFGSLYSARTRFADFIAELKDRRRACDCDDPQVTYQTEEEFLRSKRPFVPIFAARPPPTPELQTQFSLPGKC